MQKGRGTKIDPPSSSGDFLPPHCRSNVMCGVNKGRRNDWGGTKREDLGDWESMHPGDSLSTLGLGSDMLRWPSESQPLSGMDGIFLPCLHPRSYTVIGARMSHWKWRETKLQPNRARPGHQISCCFVSLHFLCDILAPITVELYQIMNVKIR